MNAYARLLLKTPYFTDSDGILYVIEGTEEPTVIDVMANVADCRHNSTMCADCQDEWLEGYDNLGFVLLTEDGPVEVPWERLT